MLKKRYFQGVVNRKTVCLSLLLWTALSITACGRPSASDGSSGSENTTVSNNLQQIIGLDTDVITSLSADDVQSDGPDQFYYEQIQKILAGSKPYTGQHKELFRRIKTMMTDKDYWDFSLYGEKKVHISTLPIFMWDCQKHAIVDNSPRIVVFSEDFTKAGICELYRESDTYEVLSIGDMDELAIDTLRGNPNQQFAFICNGGIEFMLNDNNETLGTGRYDIQIEGDYFQALQGTDIPVSFKELTDEKALLTITK